MSPKRFIAVLFMTAVLLGMFGFVAAILGGGMTMVKYLDGMTTEVVGPQVETNTPLDKAYSGVSVSGPMNIVWVKDVKSHYKLAGTEELVKAIKVRMSEGDIRFFVEGKNLHGDATITLYGPQPKSLALAGSGDATLEELNNGTFNLSISGSSNADLKGKLDSLDASIVGSGDVDADELTCKTAKAAISGSGNISVIVLEALDASIAGSGDITYKGSPKVTSVISGSGNIQKGD